MPAWVFILVTCCLLLPSQATTHISSEAKDGASSALSYIVLAGPDPWMKHLLCAATAPKLGDTSPEADQPLGESLKPTSRRGPWAAGQGLLRGASLPHPALPPGELLVRGPRPVLRYPYAPFGEGASSLPRAICDGGAVAAHPRVSTRGKPPPHSAVRGAREASGGRPASSPLPLEVLGLPLQPGPSKGRSRPQCPQSPVESPLCDAQLLAEEPEPLRCFSREFEDLTCFWDEAEDKEPGGGQDGEPYQLLFAYPGEEPQVCPLSAQRLPGGGLRHACQVQPADGLRLFAKLALWLWDPARAQNRTQRVLSVENVGLPAPPKSITAVTSGQTGELQVTWEVQPLEISDFMQHELQYGPVDPSSSTQPTVTALLQAPTCCPFMRWPRQATPAQALQQHPTIEAPAIRGPAGPQWDGPPPLKATREVPRFLRPPLLSPQTQSIPSGGPLAPHPLPSPQMACPELGAWVQEFNDGPLQPSDLIGGSCIISGFQPGTSYWLQLRRKPDGISLKGFWGPWSSPVTVTLPQDAREIGLHCFTQDLEQVTCQWQGPAHPTTSHGYFYHWRTTGSCPGDRGPAWEKCEKMDSREEETPVTQCHFESQNDSAIHILVEITTEQGTIHQFLGTPFWMHQIVLTEAPQLQWTAGQGGQLKLSWRPPLPWLPGKTHYQLRYSGQKHRHWKVRACTAIRCAGQAGKGLHGSVSSSWRPRAVEDT
ncbi:thrombopoietin receptor [Monodelphis domestica]|uniref:thrombopoietin receptor n=1 Tax=Monodelphis domestica TaxID=13616 RepID=UPI0024E25245|nr:thrombopoietin receptor [Monodelphis domestica]